MERMKSVGLGMVAAAVLMVGCGDRGNGDPTPELSQRCASPTEYLAFDAVNHQPQDLRLQRFDEMIALFDAAVTDSTKAPANAQQALALYTGVDANLQAKVKGRLDVHFTPGRAVGTDLDGHITGAIESLRNARSSQEARLAKQRFEKHGFYRFFYLSVAQELFGEPSYKHFDEAYGYLGTGPANLESGRRGLARLATKRDAANGTTLATELFDLVKEGSCSIETALKSRDAQAMTLQDDATYAQAAQKLDTRLQVVFAYSIGHELFEFNPTNVPVAHVKLVEADGFFQAIEPHMLQAGGTKADFARELRAAINEALSKVNNDPTWVQRFPAPSLLSKLETAFAIDVKG